MDPVFVKGVLALVISVVVFIGSVWLLVAMVLGARLGYFVTGTCLFGIIAIITALWVVISIIPIPSLGFGAALGPKGAETTWHALGTGNQLTKVESEFGTFDVSDYPEGSWESPRADRKLADLKGEESTLKEYSAAKPVIDSFMGSVTSPIQGKREKVQDMVQDPVSLVSGSFTLTDFKIKEVTVEKKASLIGVGRVVPSELMNATLPPGLEEGTVEEYLVKLGDKVNAGDPVLSAKTESGTIQVTADRPGRVIVFGLRKGDKVKPNAPYATVEVSDNPGAPDPVEVAAVRVRGNLRVPSVIYMIVSFALFFLHLAGLSRLEKARKTAASPLPA